MEILLKTPKILGQLIGAIVIGLIAALLGYKSVMLWVNQRKLYSLNLRYHALCLAAKDERGAHKKEMRSLLTEMVAVYPERSGLYTIMAGDALRSGKLSKAEKVYKKVASLRREDPLPRVGLAATYLRLTDTDKAHFNDHIKNAKEAIAKAKELGGNFEAGVLEGALALLEGRNDSARKIYRKLEKDLPQADPIPGREVVRCFYFNKGMAELLDNSIDCWDSFALAMHYQAEWPEATEVFALAITHFLSEQNMTIEETQRRIKKASGFRRAIASGEDGRVRRYGFTAIQRAAMYNAEGLAYFRVKDYERAGDGFQQALARVRKKSVAAKFPIKRRINYMLNLATAYHVLAENTNVEKASRKAHDNAGKAYHAVGKLLKGDKEKEEFRFELYETAAYHYGEARQHTLAKSAMETMVREGIKPVESYKVLAVISLRGGKKADAKNYLEKAIENEHPDSAELQIRLEALSRR